MNTTPPTPETLMDSYAFEQPTKISVMLPLEQVIGILEDIRRAAFIDHSEYGEGWINALKTGIERIHETATGQSFNWNPKPEPTNDDGLKLEALNPYRESGYEDVNEEFSLTWEGLTGASAPLLAFLRLKLQTWFTQNIADFTTSNIATDYDWATVLVAFPDFIVAERGKNYVDIVPANEPILQGHSLIIRIGQDYHFDPDYRDERFTRLRDRDRKAIETAIVEAALDAKIILSASTDPGAV